MRKELQKKVKQALRLLRSVSQNRGGQTIEVAYSGGKDSDVILQLAKESGINFRAIYKNTTIDPPGTINHAKEAGAEILRPKKSFFQLIREHGLPTRLKRNCCSELKEYKVLDRCIVGVRKAESRKRAERYNEPTECRGTKENPWEQIYPILDWTDEDIAEFINDRGIKCHPLYYDEKGNFHVERRLGCMGCPLISDKRRIEFFIKHPKWFRQWMRNLIIYHKTHPDSKTLNKYGDAYRHMVRDVFFVRDADFFESVDGIFGSADCKKFLEEKIGIELP